MTTDRNDNDLHGTFDAQVWAQRFVERVAEKPTIATDEMTMVAWFAGAIMSGYDWARRKPAPEPSEWMAGIGDDTPCCIQGCDYTDIDVRGPICLRGDSTHYYACTAHWEAIMSIVGRQVMRSEDAQHWSPDEPSA